MQPVRTALVGCGKVGQIHAGAIQTLVEGDLVAVCDAQPERAAAFASKYAARPFTSLDDLFAEARPEVLLVCTPHPLHADAVVRAARAGVHALVEKPLADCDTMLVAVRSQPR